MLNATVLDQHLKQELVMKLNYFICLCAWCGMLCGLLGCNGVRSAEPAVVPLSAQRAEHGDTIYFGRVFPLEGSGGEPMYVYERRVARSERGSLSTHITRTARGRVVMADAATHHDDYTLVEYTLLGNQLGQRGSIRVEGEQLRFELEDARGHRSAVEQNDDSVVVGPTLVGTIVRHLHALRSGSVISVRMAVLDRLETLAFELEAIQAPSDLTRVRMRPSSLVLAALIDPIVFTFRSDTSKLVRLEGRVPPKQRVGEWLKDLDARVEYGFVAAEYR